MAAFASSLFIRPFHNSVIQFDWTTALKQGKKSFQIILPSDVDIVFVFTRKSDNRAKWSPEAGEGGATVLSCQLPPLRAEGSKNL